MWILIVSSSFLWFNHLSYETQKQCLYHAERIESVDMGPQDIERKSLKAECVKKSNCYIETFSALRAPI